ncbi:hypothetical protein E2C01_029044 [Portunus trituberculatus]|uniref:Uncharacterized protein n=1 Tax=Portunus trituberculatus TaxID=210409 RepID=A0A5B7EQS1_PORTR|nr:hypothetical protein [Portunus trituberculatus]
MSPGTEGVKNREDLNVKVRYSDKHSSRYGVSPSVSCVCLFVFRLKEQQTWFARLLLDRFSYSFILHTPLGTPPTILKRQFAAGEARTQAFPLPSPRHLNLHLHLQVSRDH